MKPLLPPLLKHGDTIGIFSPSVPATADYESASVRAERFLCDLGYKVRRGILWGKSSSYKSGTAAERAAEFNALLYDDEVECIMAAMGGFVSNGMLPYIDYEYFSAHPKIVVGMSDVTSLLMGLYSKTGVTVYYGPNFVTGFARQRSYAEFSLKAFENAVNRRDRYYLSPPDHYSDELIDWNAISTEEKIIPNELITLCGGKAKGRLIGGNMNTLTSVWGTPYMPEIREGDILFLENTEEWAGYVERYAAWLKMCGVFDKIGGLIIGKHRCFDSCGTGIRAYEILLETIGEPHFPVLAEFDCSHCAPMLTMPLGVTAELDADRKNVTIVYGDQDG